MARVRDDRDASAPEGEPVPRLPRGRGLRLSRSELMRIMGLLGVLVCLLVTQRHCSSAVATFVTGFGSGSAGTTLPRPGTVDVPGRGAGAAPAGAGAGGRSAAAGATVLPGTAGHELDGYERLRPGMTDAEIKAAIERARARAAGSSEPTSRGAAPQMP